MPEYNEGPRTSPNLPTIVNKKTRYQQKELKTKNQEKRLRGLKKKKEQTTEGGKSKK